MDANKIKLADDRSYFIGDRVVFSQVMLFVFTGLITFVMEAVDIGGMIIPFWWLFCLILPIGSMIWIALKQDSLYFNYSWKALFGLFSLIWVSPTVYLGVVIDDYFVGTFNAFWLSVFLALIYTTGYWLAKIFRMRRQQTGSLYWKMFAVSAVIIVVASVVGGLLYSSALQESGLSPFAFFEILSCQSCVTSVYIIIAGVGIVISMLLHYYMLSCLFDPEGLSVEEDPPNHCYLRIMIISLILMFISWLLMLILIPPIAGGSGGKGKRGGGVARIRTYRTYATVRNYGQKRYPADAVEEEWKEYGLGKEGKEES